MTYEYKNQQIDTSVARANTNKIVFDVQAMALNIVINTIPGVVNGTTASLSRSSDVLETGSQTIEI